MATALKDGTEAIHPNWFKDLFGGYWAKLDRFNVGYVAVDPKTAAIVLDHHNKRNRRPVQNQIVMISKDLQAGNWIVTGETIIFDENRNCINGQNRLYAGVNSGKTFETLIVVGVPSEAFKVLDQQSRRTAGQVLQMMGEVSASNLATALSFLNYLTNVGEVAATGTIRREGAMTIADRIHLLEEHPDLRTSVTEVFRHRGAVKMFQSVGLPIALHYLTTMVKPLIAREFWTGMLEYKIPEAERYDAARSLTKRLMNNLTETAKLPVRVIAALTIKAWNAASANEQVKNLVFNDKREEFPKVTGLKYAGKRVVWE